jgi:putative hydrolase of the HAD superfamily
MIKAIIFDFFGVLVSEGFRLFCDTYFPDNHSKRQQALDLVTAHDWGKINTDDYIDGLSELAGVNRQVVIDHMYGNKPNKQLLGYIGEALKPKYKIAILSNSGEDYVNKILSPEDVKLFDQIILSYRYKMVKPQAEFFNLALKEVDVMAEECVFIDDSSSHCQGAETIGMKTILYKDFSQMKTDLEKVLADGSSSDN